ncbi:MAG: response regulator [Treponema sp.]|jgi:two-component system response regulator YesN|nr:response regulator [Treponema sp.]
MKKIMIVDDEVIVRLGIRSIVNWEEHGYTVSADASNGEEAMEKIIRRRPDIVLTDLVMPNMDGFELIRRCKDLYPDIRFVVLSSYNDFESVRKAMKLGVKDYIFKLTASLEEMIKTLDDVSCGIAACPGPMDKVVRENIQALKYSFLSRWINRSAPDMEDTASQFAALAPEADLSKPFVILYLSIDDFEKHTMAGDFKDLQTVKTSLENVVREIFNQKAAAFNYKKGDMVVFIALEEGRSGRQVPYEEEFFKIREYCKRYLGFTVSGTFGPMIANFENTPEVIRNCEDTMDQRTGAVELWPYGEGRRNEIARAKEYIRGHFMEKLTIRDIASSVGMSESYFSHVFKKETGSNVVDYINRNKIEKAAELLENHNLRIADVAAGIGLENPNYFSVLFKKLKGCTPQEYRLKCGKSGITKDD